MIGNNKNLPEAVCLLLEDNHGNILTVSRKHDKNVFGLIGGKIDSGETAIEAIIRETKEESDLTIFDCLLQLVYEGICPGEVDYYCYTFKYKFKWDKPELAISKEGCVIKWQSPCELLHTSAFASYNREVFDIVGIDYSK